jgi:cytoskeleton protein RodZ
MAALGQTLREEREARNISIEEIASATKIGTRYLEALENDRLDLMPGGFFVKGIIRTYARAVGLDENEVLARYKAAGLIGEPGDRRHSYPESEPGSSSETRAAGAPAHASIPRVRPARGIEEALWPRLSAVARKRIFTWTWRSAAVILAIVGLVVLWSSRRPRAPSSQTEAVASSTETVVTQTVIPPPQKTKPLAEAAAQPTADLSAQPSSEPSTEPAPIPESLGVVEEVWKGVTIELSFQAETWLQVYADGVLKINGQFPAGATARAQADERLLLHVGNAGGFTFLLNGKPAKPLGGSGQVRTDIKITTENYKEFLQGQSPGQPAG